MSIAPFHASTPLSAFRPRVMRLAGALDVINDIEAPTPIGSSALIGSPAVESVFVSQINASSVQGAAGIGVPGVTDDARIDLRAPLPSYRPVSRFRPRVGGIPPGPAPSSLVVLVEATPVARVPSIGAPQVIVGAAVIFASSVESVATVEAPEVIEEFSIDGGGDLPDGFGVGASSVPSVATVGSPVISDSGAVIAPQPVGAVAVVGAPAVNSGPLIAPQSVASTATVEAPTVSIPATTINPMSVTTARQVGLPRVGLQVDLNVASVMGEPSVGMPDLTGTNVARYGTRGTRTRNINKQGGGGRPAQLA